MKNIEILFRFYELAFIFTVTGQSFEILCQDIFFLSAKYDKGTVYKFG